MLSLLPDKTKFRNEKYKHHQQMKIQPMKYQIVFHVSVFFSLFIQHEQHFDYKSSKLYGETYKL